MSTELRTNAVLTEAGVSATRFFGGSDRGACVQVTQPIRNRVQGELSHSFVQLTRTEALALAHTLMDFAASQEQEA